LQDGHFRSFMASTFSAGTSILQWGHLADEWELTDFSTTDAAPTNHVCTYNVIGPQRYMKNEQLWIQNRAGCCTFPMNRSTPGQSRP
jgi:hypothetical protein